ncbi:NAD(P)H-dependent flavin oxidoreductase YrpB, nitropropane dioxygenase family [Clostridium acidisoli DSM 12555]|uniref:Probable nitronate monooxygenase n=1 Tax=Clostridium acidisoli DSM 12555 TaxID=1121291 RepID=A0A1W1XQR9_9CLOT|nr:nitronate monooxygenase family protein [Clostridium acidisoli]SMC26217.1 NAD(P)H-dependent flavin oxidoreductase YrpB, nitropropane dioxygenase family [Clostridium acidisoli DSM 12555]
MRIPPLVIGDLKAEIPIVQGGMGVGISRSRLAGAVANCKGVGIISSVQIGFDEPDFDTNTEEANERALRKHIRKAKEISPNGIIGLNIMVAVNNYNTTAKIAVEEGIDIIISGAGLPMTLPGLVEGSKTKIAPIVSSGKAAKVICKMWDKKHNRIPDLVVVEGPEAGGHLGYSLDELKDGKLKLLQIVKDVIEAVKPFEEKHNKKIPVIAAGGIYTGEEIAECLKVGAAGVQMATRFIATEECDASLEYKMEYLKCKKEDIEIVVSPVGMPGRAIKNTFINRIKQNNEKIDKCYNCLKPCNPKDTPYCISKALINSVKGNVNDGLLFTGANGYRLDKIVKVKELIDELVSDCEKALE